MVRCVVKKSATTKATKGKHDTPKSDHDTNLITSKKEHSTATMSEKSSQCLTNLPLHSTGDIIGDQEMQELMENQGQSPMAVDQEDLLDFDNHEDLANNAQQTVNIENPKDLENNTQQATLAPTSTDEQKGQFIERTLNISQVKKERDAEYTHSDKEAHN